MRRSLDNYNDFGPLWTAATRNFVIHWHSEQSFEPYDGEDEDGSIQRGLDSGDLVMFDSKVSVRDHFGRELSADYLGASVYRSGEVAQFMRDGYFSDMLKAACDGAREYLQNHPPLRHLR